MLEIIKQHVDMLVAATNGKMLSAAFIARHGKGYEVVAKPPRILEQKACYKNSWLMSHTGLAYCEGYGYIENLIPIAHAWNLEEGVVIDTTWGDTRKAVYFGVEFTPEFITEFIEKTGYPSVFGSLYMLRMSPEKVWDYLETGLA